MGLMRSSAAGGQVFTPSRQSIGSGRQSIGSGKQSIASGMQSIASGMYSIAFGMQSIAFGGQSIDSGMQSIDSGMQSIDSGMQSIGSGMQSIGSGMQSIASGVQSIGSGMQSIDSGRQSIDSGHRGPPQMARTPEDHSLRIIPSPITSRSIFVRTKQSRAWAGVLTTGSFSLTEVLSVTSRASTNTASPISLGWCSRPRGIRLRDVSLRSGYALYECPIRFWRGRSEWSAVRVR